MLPLGFGNRSGVPCKPGPARTKNKNHTTLREALAPFSIRQCAKRCGFLLCALLLTGSTQQLFAQGATLGAGATMEVLGAGNAFLLRSPLTDPDNNGNEAAGSTNPSWDWKSITACCEPGFDGTPVAGTPAGTERSFNVFDHLVDGGGAAKWCCGEPLTPTTVGTTNPLWITVEFPYQVRLTHFTVTSGNDTPARDPRDWRVLGSTNGTNWTAIFTQVGEGEWQDASVWGATRLQVNRFNLDQPAPPYSFIRWECTSTYSTPPFTTAAAFFQVSEIEYFGTTDSPRLGGSIPAPGFVQIGVIDGTVSGLDPNGVTLQIDNAAAAATVTKTGNTTTIFHTRDPFWASNSSHPFTITGRDTAGNPVSLSGAFTVPVYTTIPTVYRAPSATTTTPGFRVKTHLIEVNRNPDNGGANPAWQVGNAARQILDGYINPTTSQPYANLADLTGADAQGYLTEAEVINYNQDAPAAIGNFTDASTPPKPDEPIPGIGGDNDRFVQSVETFLDLKAGHYRLGVNSDDGFRLSFGHGPADPIGTQLGVAGDRGSTDSLMDIVITQDGFYPVRLMWWETGGGANAEFFSVDPLTGVKTLVNDTTQAAALRAYRESTETRPHVTRVFPTPGNYWTFADEEVIVDITERTIPLDANSAVLTLNGVQQTVTSSKSGSVTTVRRAGSVDNPLPSGVVNAVLVYTYTSGGTTTSATNNWSFTVPRYTRPIPPANKVQAAQVSGAGFRARGHQMDRSGDANQGNGGRNTGNNMPGPEIQLAGGYINPTTGQPYPNLLDSAAAPPGGFDIADVLNINHNTAAGSAASPANAGIFNSDVTIPGLPGTGTSNQGLDNAVYEFITYLDLKRGAYIFAVNVDDGWVVSSAPNPRDTLGTILGWRNAVGGQNGNPPHQPNAAFNVLVPEDGIYPFRILFWQGGGGVNVEFASIDRLTGSSRLVNDTAGSFPSTRALSGNLISDITAFNTYTGPTRPWTKFSVYPMPFIGTTEPRDTLGGAVTLWQNRNQQTGPGPITIPLGLLNGSWNPGEIQNSSTAQRPFGDAVGAVIADLGTGTVGMVLDGQSVTPVVTDIPGGTDKLVLYTPPTPLSSTANHVAGLVYAGTTNYWTFSVITNVVLDASAAVPASSVDTTKRGFRARVVQSATARPGGNTAAAAEAQLAGNPANIVPAGPGPDGSYIVPGIINWSSRKVPGQTGAEIGNFQPLLGGPADDPIPGLPGGASGKDNSAAEIFAYLDLPAGYQKFGVNGDDGWRVQIGTPGQTNGPILFTIDRGAGAQDIPFAFITPQAGFYPVRLVYYQGGGDGNVEFFTYGPNNSKIPVNSDAPGAIKAYQAAGGNPGTPRITAATLSGGSITVTWTGGGTLFSATSLTGPWTTTGSSNGTHTEPATTGNKFFRVQL